MSKSTPIPVRFDPEEAKIVEAIHKRTRLSRAEIVRRAVRLLQQEVEARGGVGFIIDLEEGTKAVVTDDVTTKDWERRLDETMSTGKIPIAQAPHHGSGETGNAPEGPSQPRSTRPVRAMARRQAPGG